MNAQRRTCTGASKRCHRTRSRHPSHAGTAIREAGRRPSRSNHNGPVTTRDPPWVVTMTHGVRRVVVMLTDQTRSRSAAPSTSCEPMDPREPLGGGPFGTAGAFGRLKVACSSTRPSPHAHPPGRTRRPPRSTSTVVPPGCAARASPRPTMAACWMPRTSSSAAQPNPRSTSSLGNGKDLLEAGGPTPGAAASQQGWKKIGVGTLTPSWPTPRGRAWPP